MESITKKIADEMAKNKGKIYAISDFYNLGTQNTVKSAFYRLSVEGKITRLIDGLYTMPIYSELLQEYTFPDIKEVAKKIAEKFSWTIAPTGNITLNYTGLATQMTNEYIYISDGPYREYWYQNQKIIFKHTSSRNITSYSLGMAIMIQAIKALGKDNITRMNIERLAFFAKKTKLDVNQDTSRLPIWIKNVIERVRVVNNG